MYGSNGSLYLPVAQIKVYKIVKENKGKRRKIYLLISFNDFIKPKIKNGNKIP